MAPRVFPTESPLPTVVEVQRIEAIQVAFDNQSAGEAVGNYDVLHRNGEYWFRTDVNAAVRSPVEAKYGMALTSAGSGGIIGSVLVLGIVSNNAWAFVSGALCFAASGQGSAPLNSGPIVSGQRQVALGRALGLTYMDFRPDRPRIIGRSGG
jgi:hypothetical protein